MKSEVRRWVLLGQKAMTNLDSVEKQRHYSANKGLYSQGYGLPSGHVRLWELGCKEGRMPKNWYLWTVGWRRLLKVPWTARRSNQTILKEINPEYSLENWRWSWNSSVLVICCEQLTHWKTLWCWKGLRAEGEEGVREWDGWTASLMQWTWTWANYKRWWGTERPGMLQSRGSRRFGHNSVTKQQQ